MTGLVKYLWNNIAMQLCLCARHVGKFSDTYLAFCYGVLLSSSAVSLGGNMHQRVDLPKLSGWHWQAALARCARNVRAKKAPLSHFMPICKRLLIFTAPMIKHWCLLFYVHPNTMDGQHLIYSIYPRRTNRLIQCFSWHKYHPQQNWQYKLVNTAFLLIYTWPYHLVIPWHHDGDRSTLSIHIKYISNKKPTCLTQKKKWSRNLITQNIIGFVLCSFCLVTNIILISLW